MPQSRSRRYAVAVAVGLVGATIHVQRTATQQKPGDMVGAWLMAADYPIAIEEPAVGGDGTYVYAAGGYSCCGGGGATAAAYRYDPGANVWTSRVAMPTPVYASRGAYAPPTHSLYVFGGIGGQNGPVLTTTYKYDVAADSWTTAAPMPEARYVPNVVYSETSGKIYVIGGFNSSFVETNQTWAYDPVANTWDISRANTPTPMAGSGTSTTGQYIYLVGDYSDAHGNTHYRYDIAGNAWTTMAALSVLIYRPMASVLGNRVYLVGGGYPSVPHGEYRSTYVYDIAANSWSSGPTTNAPHFPAAGTKIGSRLIVFGGFAVGGNQVDVETSLCTSCNTPFTDPTLTPGVTPIKLVHFTEARIRINAQRMRFGLAAAVWTSDSPFIKAADVIQMRVALNEAYTAHSLTPPLYTDPMLSAGLTIKAVHIQELRDAILTLENSP